MRCETNCKHVVSRIVGSIWPIQAELLNVALIARFPCGETRRLLISQCIFVRCTQSSRPKPLSVSFMHPQPSCALKMLIVEGRLLPRRHHSKTPFCNATISPTLFKYALNSEPPGTRKSSIPLIVVTCIIVVVAESIHRFFYERRGLRNC